MELHDGELMAHCGRLERYDDDKLVHELLQEGQCKPISLPGALGDGSQTLACGDALLQEGQCMLGVQSVDLYGQQVHDSNHAAVSYRDELS